MKNYDTLITYVLQSDYLCDDLDSLTDEDLRDVEAIMYLGRDGLDGLSGKDPVEELALLMFPKVGGGFDRDLAISSIAGKATCKDYLRKGLDYLHEKEKPSAKYSKQLLAKMQCLENAITDVIQDEELLKHVKQHQILTAKNPGVQFVNDASNGVYDSLNDEAYNKKLKELEPKSALFNGEPEVSIDYAQWYKEAMTAFVSAIEKASEFSRMNELL